MYGAISLAEWKEGLGENVLAEEAKRLVGLELEGAKDVLVRTFCTDSEPLMSDAMEIFLEEVEPKWVYEEEDVVYKWYRVGEMGFLESGEPGLVKWDLFSFNL